MYSYAIKLDEHRQYLDFTSPEPYDWRLYNDFGIRMIEIIIYELHIYKQEFCFNINAKYHTIVE